MAVSFAFETLDLQGIRTLVDWARNEGWNPGPSDADVFYQTDPAGFRGFLRDGELIAGGAIVSYGGDFGFMGLFIVKPEYRAEGIGRDLWYQRRDTLLARLKKGSAIGMDGVVAMQPFYQKGGFTIAFRDYRYALQGSRCPVDQSITSISSADFEIIQKYDTRCFGVDRKMFLSAWLSMPGIFPFKSVRDGELNGFVVLRKASSGYKVGPLFARDLSTAVELFHACLDAVPGEMVFLDIPGNNPDAQQLVREHHMTEVFECARMYYGTPPVTPAGQIFGITSFELG